MLEDTFSLDVLILYRHVSLVSFLSIWVDYKKKKKKNENCLIIDLRFISKDRILTTVQ